MVTDNTMSTTLPFPWNFHVAWVWNEIKKWSVISTVKGLSLTPRQKRKQTTK